MNVQPLFEPFEKLGNYISDSKKDSLTDLMPMDVLHVEPMIIGITICFMIYLSSSWIYSKTK